MATRSSHTYSLRNRQQCVGGPGNTGAWLPLTSCWPRGIFEIKFGANFQVSGANESDGTYNSI